MATKPPTTGIEPIDGYVADVLSGRITTGRYVRLAVERHVRDLRTAAAGGRYVFRASKARHALGFFPRYCRHSLDTWAGQPFTLQPWQSFFVGSLFGWYDREAATRRFREAYMEVARKNGKSTLWAALALYLLIGLGIHGAKVYAAATKRDQAKLIFDEACRMTRRSPGIRRIAHITQAQLEIRDTDSTFEPLSADYNTLDGLNPSAAVIDELHAHKTRAVYDVLDTALGARLNALIASVTTAGAELDSVCRGVHDYSVSVLEGQYDDPRFFAFVACLDEADNWDDESVWPKANPSLGVSVRIEDLRAQALKAKGNPENIGAFQRYRCNLWVSGDHRPITNDLWQSVRIVATMRDLDDWAPHGGALRYRANPAGVPWPADGRYAINYESLNDLGCVAGLDLAEYEDLAALVLVFDVTDFDAEDTLAEITAEAIAAGDEQAAARLPEGLPQRLFLPWFWAPEGGIDKKSEKHRLPYRALAEAGRIELTPGAILKHWIIRDRIVEIADRFGVQSIAYDPHNAVAVAGNLADDHGLDMVRFGQTFVNFSEPTKRFLAGLRAGTMRHTGHPIFTAHALNLSVATDSNGNVRPIKEKRGSPRKIDGQVAAIMGYSLNMGLDGDDGGPIVSVVNR